MASRARAPGQNVTFAIPVYSNQTVKIVNAEPAFKQEWFTLLTALPLDVSSRGNNTIKFMLKIPANIYGSFNIPVEVKAAAEGTTLTATSYVKFTVSEAKAEAGLTEQIAGWLSNPTVIIPNTPHGSDSGCRVEKALNHFSLEGERCQSASFPHKASPIIMLLLFLAAFSLVHVTPEARADGVPPGWLSGYTYRKKHAVTGAAGAGVGYQMMFIVRRSSGTDANNTVYVSGKCKEDFSDVRFADADGNVFPYAITYKTSDEAWFWIKPSLDLSQNQYIYIYYGNPEAQDESNLDSTFIFAEPWDNATLNSRWTVDNAGNGYQIDTAQKRIRLNAGARLKSTRTLYFASNYRVEKFSAPQYATTTSLYCFNVGAYLWAGSSGQRVVFSIHNAPWSDSDFGVAYLGYRWYVTLSNNYAYITMGIGHSDKWSSSNLGYNTYAEYSFYIFRNSTSNYITVSTSYSNVTVSYLNVESADRIYLANMGFDYAYFYAFKIRKYVSPEPSHGEWYQEEAITATQAKLNVNVEPSWLSYVAFTLDYPTQDLVRPMERHRRHRKPHAHRLGREDPRKRLLCFRVQMLEESRGNRQLRQELHAHAFGWHDGHNHRLHSPQRFHCKQP
jgi:hypothetical protein